MQSPQGLLFNSIQYGLFLVAVVGVYWLLARVLPDDRARRARQILLLVSSYLFYATWDWRFCVLLAFVTGVNFVVGRRIAATDDPRARRNLLLVAIVSTIGTLVVFKYLGFLVDSFEALLRAFGIKANWVLQIAVPLGISFFTLHTLSYSVDVYRRELEPTDDLIVFAIFVAYFPQLLAGPLTRGKRMLPQFEHLPRSPNKIKWQAGLELILIGLFQKVAVADALAPVTGPLFTTTANAPGAVPRNFLLLFLGLCASVIQFVLDYAGYSNIARGSSKLLGIELPYNFRQPITRSRNFQDYWRRHNMTLMAWFRDYVLRPLRRRNDTAIRSSILLIFVFTLSGLWHVASWGWVVWGLFVGVWVALEIQVNRYREADRRARIAAELADERERIESEQASAIGPADATGASSALATVSAAPATATTHDDHEDPPSRLDALRPILRQVGASIYVVSVLGFSMVLFRSLSLRDAWSYYTELFRFGNAPIDGNTLGLFLYAIVAVIIVDHREHRMELVEGKADPPTVPRAVLWGLMITLLIIFSGGVLQPFVYFQF